jgi:hypothetical protein
VVNQVLRNRYLGNMDGIEERVRGTFMNSSVDCPVFGELNVLKCREWRELARAKNPSLHNPTRVTMVRACPNCPIFQQGMTK